MQTKNQVTKNVKNNKKSNRPKRRRGPQDTRPPPTPQSQALGRGFPITRGDPRSAVPTTKALISTNCKQTLTHEVTMDQLSLNYLVSSWVSLAIGRGFLASASDPNIPFYAATYAVGVLVNAANGTTVSAGSVPYWFLSLMHVLGPKNCTMDEGTVSFKWSGLLVDDAPLNRLTIAQPYGYDYFYLVPNSGQVDGFPTGDLSTGYTDSVGADAFQAIAQFMANGTKTLSFGYFNRMVPTGTKTPYQNNVSTFAWQSTPEGSGANSAGGWGFIVNHEIPIRTPMLSTFYIDQVNGNNVNEVRYPRVTLPFAGDVGQIAPLMSVLSVNQRNWNFHRVPKYHFVDFLELGDVLANWVSLLQNQFFTQAASATTPPPLTAFQCPLSLQELLLVLRNEIMWMFSNGQVAGQYLSPTVAQSDSENRFVSYLCGTNTMPQGSVGLKLPLPFVENVKSLTARCIFHRDKQSDVEWFISVLGQYYLDVLDPLDYTFQYNDGTAITTHPSFTTLEAHVKRRQRLSKGQDTWVPMSEALIDFIDGSSGTSTVFINDTDRLQELATSWNTWVNTLSQFCSPLTTMAQDIGINIAVSSAMTLHWSNISITQSARESDYVDDRMKQVLVSSNYSARKAVAITSKAALLAGPTEEILSQWILPINQIVSTGSVSQTKFSRIQDLSTEPFSIALTATGDNGMNMAARHVSYAGKMIHGLNAPPSTWDTFFSSVTNGGGGGILSSLVANIAGQVFGGDVGNIASKVAGMLPV